ncbi:hypothetical protein V866_001006 [Kwoniella sp. B9012]|uniref:Uncharacterized protein n=1 Tax=Kwoniella europaea PYCC6329 TaxID=1423913 RepID=A0AAX4KBZ2_9TREE
MSNRPGERFQQPQSPISHQTRYDSEFQSERSSMSLRSHFDLVEPTIHLPPTSKALQEISFRVCPSSSHFQTFSALAESSFISGTRRSFEWVHDPSLLDEAISRCLTILLKTYDDTYSLLEGEGLEGRGRRMELIRPTDVLWVLIHTCDHHILDCLERVMEIMKNSTKRMTQRWIILTILLYTIRSGDQIDKNHYHTRRRRARDDEGFKGWAKRQALLFARNFWTLDDCQAISNQTRNQDGMMKYIDDDEGLENIKRVSTAEIRRVIIEEQYRYDTNGDSNRTMNKNKRKIITYEDLYAVESDIEEKSEDGDNHTNKRVRR